MGAPIVTGRTPPLVKALYATAFVTALWLMACAFLLSSAKAHADEAGPDPGTTYVQYRFADGSETSAHRAFATYTADKKSYTARINASGEAISVEGRWKATAGGSDITAACSYDPETGLVAIPRTYLHHPVDIVVTLDAYQASKTFEANVSIVSGSSAGQASRTTVETTAGATSLTLPVNGAVKAVTQDSRVLDPSEYRLEEGLLHIEGRSMLAGSITVYLDGFKPELENRNPIKDHDDTALQRSVGSVSMERFASRSAGRTADRGSWIDGWGWIWSTNPGPGDWDYTDYVLSWDNRHTAYLTCCQHGVYHMPESDGGMVYFTGTRISNDLVNSWDTYDETTIFHHKTYRNTYYVYVNAGYYQDVDGYWSEDYETVTTSPRYGGIDLTKISADPSITDGNDSYSTAGAVYGIYSDAACTYQLNSITTNSSGKASLWGFHAGSTVYVKETKPSPGYNLDPTVYRVDIAADQWSRVNGGIVHEPPKTATVRFYADGSLVHSVARPLGTNFATSDPDVRKADGLAAKPHCTPGLDAWYYDAGFSSSFSGTRLDGDLALYARNVATVTYAPAAGSPLAEELPFRKAMSESSPLLDVATDVLPPSRQVDWGHRITLKEPRLKILYYSDGKRWRTLRWRGGGWHLNPAATGEPVETLKITRDATVYGDWSRSTYDGIFSW